MNRERVPYKMVVFCCTNRRENSDKPCCGGRGGETLRALLKSQAEERGLRGKVRVSQSGCLGQCPHGPNIMVFPQGVWFSATTEADVPAILDEVERLLQES